MHKFILLTSVAALAATPALAQRHAGPRGAGAPRATPMPTRPGGHWQGPRHGGWSGRHVGRWGGRVNGRWYAGVYAPGGWAAYRRPVVGWVLPTYWYTPNFYVTDWAGYGLPAPHAGRTWTRYYDDAVLVDADGRVYDSRSDIDWESEQAEAPPPTAAPPPAAPIASTPPSPPPPTSAGERRDDGVGGAAIGAVAGGVVGNVIAGRGNRLGGTLVGAGVGALTGMAIDKAEDRRRDRDLDRAFDDREPPIAPDEFDGPPESERGAPYSEPRYPERGYPPPPAAYRHAPPAVADHGTMIDHGAPHGRRSYVLRSDGTRPYTHVIHGPGTVTTVTVVPAVTTTTTTEHVYAPVARHSAKRAWRPSKTKLCKCR